MNKKLIAAAVSAAVMAPVAAHAESSFYARVNNAIDINDLSGDGTTDCQWRRFALRLQR